MYKVFFNDRIVFLTDTIPPEKFSRENILQLKQPDALKPVILDFSVSEIPDQLIIYYPDIQNLYKHFITLFNYIEAAGGLVKNRSGEFLVILRNGKWDLPKGKIDVGENSKIAATREISEECGITGQKLIRHLTDTYHTYEEGQKRILKKSTWYKFSYNGNEMLRPQTKEGITEVRWIKHKELEYVFKNTYPSIKDVFAAAGIKR